ncbi:type III-B CRISPR-associated protein Cas10/Cmr2 [Synechococcus sp. PCC 7336]|uniref:type III-B CRISPR-associated protein Cas10/Cmr2 n=1 Tax=Synechococcus sp. PCC 7336 TaxID=195250 RepID=UPI001D0D28D3|nr:type III-B CRISPR-associated protein Cas10/Cmr2 [Synechococcus sp. PCC 7336]
MAGALTGYERPEADPQGDRPYLATFTFTPIQDVIKASRKMRDFWAGSWVAHYLAAKICWTLAQQYGPDCLIYPSLFQQPPIDRWLRKQSFTPDTRPFEPLINNPDRHKLLTAGFPNVIVALLPYRKVRAAMQTAAQTLKTVWVKDLGGAAYHYLQNDGFQWMPNLQADNRTWNGWLQHQWQPYWSALPVGSPAQPLAQAASADLVPLEPWLAAQNHACNLKQNGHREAISTPDKPLFQPAERQLIGVLAETQTHPDEPLGVNVGSWWPYIFDQLRFSLAHTKAARVWSLPTAFGPRSTISGLGPVVYPDDKATCLSEANTGKFWGTNWEVEMGHAKGKRAGLFDGREQLNATETLKRCLHKILASVEGEDLSPKHLAIAYPDLTSGVAGYLKAYEATGDRYEHFQAVCKAIATKHQWANNVAREINGKWGIPYHEQKYESESYHPPDDWLISEVTFPHEQKYESESYHPRFLNPGWMVEDDTNPQIQEQREALQRIPSTTQSEENRLKIKAIQKKIYDFKIKDRQSIADILSQYYPSNNPADWYVLAAGDGDGMRHWLKGSKLDNYSAYAIAPEDLPNPSDSLRSAYTDLLQLKKRMGPSTHNALSRALLDFSNQLLPHLTERRYAGRLIYGGGDDILAYTNLWEWDRWLWDVRQCFRGAKDPAGEFAHNGDYWHPPADTPGLPHRPLFTLGHKATLSCGVIIAHHSVPLAIALSHLWEAEAAAKKHVAPNSWTGDIEKDALQTRILFGNGNVATATAKFAAFHTWQKLLNCEAGSYLNPNSSITSALFEQAAQLWGDRPAPVREAIAPWTQAFVSRRDAFGSNDVARCFSQKLQTCLESLWDSTLEQHRQLEPQNWLKLAAFTLRHRTIAIRTPQEAQA